MESMQFLTLSKVSTETKKNSEQFVQKLSDHIVLQFY